MATIGSLIINLSMGTAAFGRGVKSVNNGLGSIGRMATSTAGLVTGAIAGISVGGAVVGLKSLHDSSSENIDNIGKLADRLSISTEQFTRLAHAAGLAGVSQDSFTGMLEKMTKNLGIAAMDGGPVADSLSSIGLSARTLANQSPDQAFLNIADAIAKIENPAQRARAATDIFGKGAQSLLNTLMTGRAGIEATGREADKLGISFSRVDAAKVEAANDSLSRAGAAITGLGNQLAIGLSPFIDAAAVKFTDLASSGGGIGSIVAPSLESAATGLAVVADIVDTVVTSFQFVQIWVNKAVQAWMALNSQALYLYDLVLELAGADPIGPQLAEASKILGEEIAEMEKAFNERLIAPSWGDQVRKTFADIKRTAEESGKAAADAVTKPFGAIDIALASVKTSFADLAKSPLANSLKASFNSAKAAVLPIGGVMKQMEEERSRLKSFADDIKVSTMTPQEQLDKGKKDLDLAFQQGFLTESQKKRGLSELQDQFRERTGENKERVGVSALERGSSEAFAAVARQRNNPQDKTAENTAETVKVLRRIETKFGQSSGQLIPAAL